MVDGYGTSMCMLSRIYYVYVYVQSIHIVVMSIRGYRYAYVCDGTARGSHREDTRGAGN